MAESAALRQMPPAVHRRFTHRYSRGPPPLSDSGPLTSRWYIITVCWRSTVGLWFIISSITLTEMSLHTLMDKKQCKIAIANLLNIQMHLQYMYQMV